MNFDFMTSIFLFHDKNTSINDKSIISEKVYFCNVNFMRHHAGKFTNACLKTD